MFRIVLASFVVTLALTANAQEADLAVSKTGPETAAPGDEVAYTVTITNAGPDAASTVLLDDPVPPGMTFVSAAQESGPAFTCDDSSCTIASLPAGASAEFTFVFEIDASAAPGDTFTNVATGKTATADPNEENNSGSAATTVPAVQADLFLGKGGPSFAAPDSNITFTITLGNGGPSGATNVLLTDVLPDDLTFVSLGQSGTSLSCTTPAVGANGTIICTAATYAAGASTTLTLTVHVPSQDAAGEYTNTAEVKSDNDPAEENNVATFSVTILSADLSVDKTGPATVDAMSNVAYTLLVRNDGPDAVPATLTDQIPEGTTFVSIVRNSGPTAVCGYDGVRTVACSFEELGLGQSATFTLTVNAGTTASITNTATITGAAFDPDQSDNSDSVTTTVTPRADLSVSKSGPATIIAGRNITYTVTVTNNGPSAAANVSVTDAITSDPSQMSFVRTTQPSGPVFNCASETCTLASFASGATATFEFTYTVQPGATGTVNDTATITSPTADPVAGNNSAPFSSTVTTLADLTLDKLGPGVAASGTDVVYRVTARNLGPSNAVNAVMTDVLPAGTTFVSLSQSGIPFSCTTGQTVVCTAASFPAMASTEFLITARVDPAATGTIENSASITSSTPEVNPADNSDTVVTGLNPGATDLSIVKTASAASLPAGSAVTYTIDVRNNGPAVAFETTVTDVLPAGTTLESASATQGSCTGTTTVVCSLGTLAPAGTATVTLVVRLPRASGTVGNTATVTAANADTSPANNSSTVPLAVTAEIPTLSEWALIALALMLAFVAAKTMRA